ncbi:MAG: beta-lactamase family protein [bacterium]|nr:serine hydrolase [Deltaproteobacteria bacterium]MCP4907654.1 beta-lactamase family protein [bacterium]
MFRISSLFLLVTLSLIGCINGHAPLHGFSEQRLARITEGMQRHIDAGTVAGVVTLVQRHGEILHGDVLGHQDREAGTPMQADTIFRIYSMSKPITSVAVLMLLEEGKLRLTEPVDRLLPELADPVVLLRADGPLEETRLASGPITIRDLLIHTSGLAYEFTSTGPLSEGLRERGLLGSSSRLSPDEWIGRLGEVPLMRDPGTRWHYSLSTDALGVLVERASGMPFAEFLERRVFQPLGMRDTSFWVPEEKITRLAVNYSRDPETGELVIFDHPSDTRYSVPPIFASGGGGLVSTAGDYIRFAAMLTNGGEFDGVRILSRKTVELMTTNALWPEERTMGAFGSRFFLAGQGFGLGVSVVEDLGAGASLGSIGQNGWGGAAGTWYWSDPKEGLSAVVMIQLMGNGAAALVSQDFQTLVYQALVD